MELVALKVRIGKKENGQADYPAFGRLVCVLESGVDWSIYIDRHGQGWAYDKSCGHDEESEDSPLGQQWGMILVEPVFAEQAEAMFPDDVEPLTEAEAEVFWETKACRHMPDMERDTETLQAMAAERSLRAAQASDVGKSTALAALDAEIARALDPDDDAPGVRRNTKKLWASRKAKAGLTLREPATKRAIPAKKPASKGA